MLSCRVDRLATLYFFQPIKRKMNPVNEVRIPILMYHSVADMSDQDMHSYYQTTISPAAFEEQMSFLCRNHYVAINLNDALQQLQDQKSNGRRKVVVLTFDDGYRDLYTQAFPILEKYGFKATAFLSTGFIGKRPLHFQRTECLSWTDVRELHRYGMSFGSHSVTHPKLRYLDETTLQHELTHSRDTIQEELGSTVDSFSYPFAFPEEDKKFTRKLRNLMGTAGYAIGVSTILGTASLSDDRLFLKRLPMSSEDDLALFKAKLEGAYDWLHSLQYIKKMAQSKFNSAKSH